MTRSQSSLTGAKPCPKLIKDVQEFRSKQPLSQINERWIAIAQPLAGGGLQAKRHAVGSFQALSVQM